MKHKPVINYKKIKRDIIQEQTGFDSRYITRFVKTKKIYTRKQKHKSNEY
jgi:hypothetical protein